MDDFDVALATTSAMKEVRTLPHFGTSWFNAYAKAGTVTDELEQAINDVKVAGLNSKWTRQEPWLLWLGKDHLVMNS